MKTIKCVRVKLPLHIHKQTKYPEPSFYREITALKDGKIEIAYIESIYWLEHNIYSQKQLKWLGDIKVKIKHAIPEAVVTTLIPESNLIIASAKPFDLKDLSDIWNNQSEHDESNDEVNTALPRLIPMQDSGKIEYDMYTTLCRYATRLFYEKLFVFEYLLIAAKKYNKRSEKKILAKKLLANTHKAFDYISQEIENNPKKFKQKLNSKELRDVRVKNSIRLQFYNQKIKKQNMKKVINAIDSGKYYKADGKTVNTSLLAKEIGLSRLTTSRLIKISLNPNN